MLRVLSSVTESGSSGDSGGGSTEPETSVCAPSRTLVTGPPLCGRCVAAVRMSTGWELEAGGATTPVMRSRSSAKSSELGMEKLESPGGVGVWVAPGEHGVEHEPDREQVGARVDGLAFQLLRREPAQCARDHSFLRRAARARDRTGSASGGDDFRDAEVEQLDH